MRAVLRFLGTVLGWAVLLALVAVLLAAVAVPRFAGATPYTVLTGSMRPGFPPGTLLIVRPVDASTLAVGDVVTYQLRSGRAETVTHRIESLSMGQRGETTFVTRGDANPVADRDPVRAVQIRGRVWYGLPLLGHLTTWSTVPVRIAVVGAIVAALVLYAAVNLIGALRDRRHVRRAGRTESGAVS